MQILNVENNAGSVQCRTASAQVVLTREKGKNAKLAKLLDQKQISWAEIPLIETIDGPDRLSRLQISIAGT